MQISAAADGRSLAAGAKAFLEKSHVQKEPLQTIDKVLKN